MTNWPLRDTDNDTWPLTRMTGRLTVTVATDDDNDEEGDAEWIRLINRGLHRGVAHKKSVNDATLLLTMCNGKPSDVALHHDMRRTSECDGESTGEHSETHGLYGGVRGREARARVDPRRSCTTSWG